MRQDLLMLPSLHPPVRRLTPFLALTVVLGFAFSVASQSPPTASGRVDSFIKITSGEGGLGNVLTGRPRFGQSVVSLGDLDGDGAPEVAVGAPDSIGGGALWILFLDPNEPGTVKSHRKIGSGIGGFNGLLTGRPWFGWGVTSLGDLNGDGAVDIAVSAKEDDDGGEDHGAVWILFMDPNDLGSVKSEQKISSLEGGFIGPLMEDDYWGYALTALGDVDGDGLTDLAVSAPWQNWSPETRQGAVWILFLNSDGTVKSEKKIGPQQGGFTGVLQDYALFGTLLASLGDLDGDGIAELAVGSEHDNGPRPPVGDGAVWILFLNSDGSVRAHHKIREHEGGFTGRIERGEHFGGGGGIVGDLDGDGVNELVVSQYPLQAFWLLFLNADGTVKRNAKIMTRDEESTVGPVLPDSNRIGMSATGLGDLNADGIPDIMVGAPHDGDFPEAFGAVWVLFMEVAPQSREQQKCINTLNKGAAKVMKAQGGEILSCLKNASRERLLGTLEECLTDIKRKVQKARGKLDDKVGPGSSCDSANAPNFGFSSAATGGQASIDKELRLVHSIFGSNLDSGVIATDKTDSRCQQGVWKAVQKCQDTKIKVFSSCKKNELKGKNPSQTKVGTALELQDACLGVGSASLPDPKGKVLGKCLRGIQKAIDSRCPGLNTAALFPGCGGPVSVACLDTFVECEVCKALNEIDVLSRDCDEFDDGVGNGSCL